MKSLALSHHHNFRVGIADTWNLSALTALIKATCLLSAIRLHKALAKCMQRDKSAATGIFTVYAGKKAEKYRITDLFDIFVKCKLT